MQTLNAVKKHLLVILFKGFEEIEAIGSVDILRRAGVAVTTATVENNMLVHVAQGVGVLAEKFIHDVDADSFDALLIPGGPGVFVLRQNTKLLELIGVFARAHKLVAAICAAPVLLEDVGLLKGRKYTAHNCIHEQLAEPPQNVSVVTDGNLITGNGPGAALAFAVAVARQLMGPSTVSAVAQAMAID